MLIVTDPQWEHNPQAGDRQEILDQLCEDQQYNSTDSCAPSTLRSTCPTQCTTKCMAAHKCEAWTKSLTFNNITLGKHLLTFFFLSGLSHNSFDDSWDEIQSKRMIRAENEVEANKLANNYRVGSLDV